MTGALISCFEDGLRTDFASAGRYGASDAASISDVTTARRAQYGSDGLCRQLPGRRAFREDRAWPHQRPTTFVRDRDAVLHSRITLTRPDRHAGERKLRAAGRRDPGLRRRLVARRAGLDNPASKLLAVPDVAREVVLLRRCTVVAVPAHRPDGRNTEVAKRRTSLLPLPHEREAATKPPIKPTVSCGRPFELTATPVVPRTSRRGLRGVRPSSEPISPAAAPAHPKAAAGARYRGL
jgi:hypothetical protein